MSLLPTNSTTPDEGLFHGWMSPPQTRGTSDVLYTCLTTIVLCVYTAVHLNIPTPGEKPRRQGLRQAKWTIIGIIAPEIVLFSAWTQYCQASSLVRELNALSSAKQQSRHSQPGALRAASPSANKFDLKYGFYAARGGFRVIVEDFSDTMATAALTPKAIIRLAREGVHCYIDPSTIEDKSKANNLAKILVIFQVSWMVVQCIARKLSGLPLTLLEIHTFIHAVSAAILYAFWFNKPLGIGEASVIQVPQSLEGLVASLFLHSKSCHIAALDGLDEYPNGAGISVTAGSLICCKESKPPVTSRRATVEVLRVYATHRRSHISEVYYFLENLPNTAKVAQFWIPITDCYHSDIVLSPELATCTLAASRYTGSVFHPDEDGSKGAAFLLERLQNMTGLSNTDSPPDHFFPCLRFAFSKVVVSFTGLLYAAKLPEIKTGFAAILIQAIYGGVHLSAWEAAFPSNLEQILWRVSCILIATFTIAVFTIRGIISVWGIVMEKVNWRHSDPINKRIIAHLLSLLQVSETVLALILLLLSLLLILAMGAARCYIVVESFICLRVVPAGVYRAIVWADYIPHI